MTTIFLQNPIAMLMDCWDFHYMIKKQLVKRKTVTIFNLAHIQALPVTCNQVQAATRRDPILSKIVDYVRRDDQSKCQITFHHINQSKSQITFLHINQSKKKLLLKVDVYYGVFMSLFQKGYKIEFYRKFTRNHPALTRMKAIARSYM